MPRSEIAPFHPFAPECHADPYPCHRQLLDSPELCYVAPLDSWFVARYADVVAGLREPGLRGRPVQADDLEQLSALVDHQLAIAERPERRELVAQAFVRFDAAGLRNRVRHACEHALHRVRPFGRLDLVRDYAAAVTSELIPELFGVHHVDRERFLQWCKTIHHATMVVGQPRSVLRVGNEAARELVAYVGRLIADRRVQPRDDLLGALVSVEGLSDEEALASVVPLAIAGTETTTNLLGLGVLALLRNPAQLRLLRGSPDLVPSAVEELLRYDSPVQLIPRRARTDVSLAGQPIRAGQNVLLVIGAANRDPSVFGAPDELDLTRVDNRHLTFGLDGADGLGAPLVRLQAEIALHTLLRRLPSIELADPAPTYLDGPAARGLRSLTVRFYEGASRSATSR